MKMGLTYTGSEKKHQNYMQWLQSYTGTAIEVITFSTALNNGNEIDQCDGMVFSGGVDSHPRFYQGATGYANEPEIFEEDRDEFEIALFQAAQKNNIPVLGICRGMQLINCIYGGNMVQDLGEKGNATHKALQLQDKRHAIRVEAETLLSEITGEGQQEVNSAHHQSVNRIGDGLRINARAADGTVEGLERIDKNEKPFLLLVQWHPERMYSFQLDKTPASKKIRDYFLDEVQKNKSNK